MPLNPPDFETLAGQHKDSVYRQMIRVCGNREDAEDILIEALLKAYRHLDQLRESAAFRTWLARIARRVYWQLKEREALLPLLQLSSLEEEGLDIPGREPGPEQELARGQMKQLLDAAVAALPPAYCSVYQLRDIEDRPGDEVSAKLGISRAAMKSRLHRARKMVRAHLDQGKYRSKFYGGQSWKSPSNISGQCSLKSRPVNIRSRATSPRRTSATMRE